MGTLVSLTIYLLVGGMGYSAPTATEPEANRPDAAGRRVNVLLLLADDLNYDSLGVTGCKVPGITPNLDRLAAEGMRFEHAHVTVAVCQPSRSALMTGRYPYRNGAMGFEPIRLDVPTLPESLRAAGYLNGIMAKVEHLAPIQKFCWDVIVRAEDLGEGRNPGLYYQQAKAFFDRARGESRPFFLMANSQDPHRPFAGSRQEGGSGRRKRNAGAGRPPVGRVFAPGEVFIPGFLPDLPGVREELAQYFTSVNRCDETVGQVLKALQDAGQQDSTLVMFLSDNGMSFPYSKTNCYPASTQTPWIVRWPGKVKPGTIDKDHFVSGIDFAPTILEAAAVQPIKGVDGRSFVRLLQGERMDGRDKVFTQFYRTSARIDFPMRAVQTSKCLYIWNPWSDGKTVFKNEAQGGLSFSAMREAATTDPAVAARVTFFLHRVPEEFYAVDSDPYALKNLIDDPSVRDAVARFRADLLAQMHATGDPLAQRFDKDVVNARSK